MKHYMHKTSIPLLLLALLAVAISACSSGKFKISGKLSDITSANLHIAYYTVNGVKDAWVTTHDNGSFEFTGESAEPTMAVIYDTQSQAIACIEVQNGDAIEVSGSPDKRYQLTISGSETNEKWSGFLNEHAKQFEAGNKAATNAAIEKYIKANPDDLTSTLLLLVNYDSSNDPERAKNLLNGISTDAKPLSIICAFEALTATIGKSQTEGSLPILLMINAQTGKFGQLKYNASSLTLLYIWGGDNEQTHKADIGRLKTLHSATSDKRLQIADISLEADSSFWRSTIARDSAQWLQFWVPEGPLGVDLKPLHITSTPLAVLADSTGRVLWRGADCSTAAKMAESQLKKLK